nr:hypothetical protein [Cereibacter sphaeroides]
MLREKTQPAAEFNRSARKTQIHENAVKSCATAQKAQRLAGRRGAIGLGQADPIQHLAKNQHECRIIVYDEKPHAFHIASCPPVHCPWGSLARNADFRHNFAVFL